MSYVDCEAGMVATLQTLTTWFVKPEHVTKADMAILAKGIEKAAAIVIPGGVGPLNDSPAPTRTWDVIVGLFYRSSKTPSAVAASFVAMRDAVIEKVDNTPALGSTASAAGIWNTKTASMSDPEPYTINPKRGGIQYVCQWFRFTVYQTVSI